MTRLPKHHSDINEYTKKMRAQCEVVTSVLEGAIAEIEHAQSYFKNEDVSVEDAKLLRVIDSIDLKIACDDMNQIIKNIRTKFSKKD